MKLCTADQSLECAHWRVAKDCPYTDCENSDPLTRVLEQTRTRFASSKPGQRAKSSNWLTNLGTIKHGQLAPRRNGVYVIVLLVLAVAAFVYGATR